VSLYGWTVVSPKPRRPRRANTGSRRSSVGGIGTSPMGGARRRRARQRGGELKGIGAGKRRAPRRQVPGYLVGGQPGHAEDRPCAESCRRGSRPVAYRSEPRETYPKADDRASWRGPPTRDGPAPVNRCAPNDAVRERDVRPPGATSDARGARRCYARARVLIRVHLESGAIYCNEHPAPLRDRGVVPMPAPRPRDSIAAERELRSGCRLHEPVLPGRGHRRPWRVRSPFCPRHVHSAEQSGAHPGAQPGSHSWLDPSKGRVGRGQGPW
jgi:hypothetical protein